MTQAEYKRPRSAGRRKMAVVTLLVLGLCLACFALGIMVGGSESVDEAEKAPDQTSVSASVRKTSESNPPLPGSGQDESKQLMPRQKTAPEEQGKDLGKAQDVSAEDKTSAQTKDEVVQEIPLGSGINPRKKSAATDVAVTQETEQETTVSAPQVSTQTPASQDSSSVSAAEEKPSSSAPQVTAANEGKYVVQIASFRAEADAGALAQKLKPEFPAYVREVDLNEKGIWFRVLVGPLAQRQEADEVQRRVKESAKLDGFVKKAP